MVLIALVVAVGAVVSVWLVSSRAALPTVPDTTPVEALSQSETLARRRVAARPPDTAEPSAIGTAPSLEAPPARTVSVSGRVLEADGTPVSGVLVVLVGGGEAADDARTPSSSTADDGGFAIDGVVPGPYRVEARPTGRAAVGRDVDLDTLEPTTRVELVLLAAQEVEFRIVDDAGLPVPGARLHLRADGFDGVHGTSDGDGQWTGRLERPRTLTVETDREAALMSPAPVVVEPGAGRVVVVLDRTVSATGVVLDPEGRPIPGAFLDVYRDGAKSSSVRAGDDGAFEVDVGADATVDLVLSGMAFTRSKIGRIPFVGRLVGVRAGDAGLELRAEHEVLDATLDVVVRTPRGDAAAGVRVWASGPLGRTYEILHTDGEGHVRFERLPARPVRLWANADAIPAAGLVLPWGPHQVVPAGQRVEIQLAAARAISGRVVSASGAAAPHVSVVALRGHTALARAGTDEDGSFELRVPADLLGDVIVRASQNGADGRRRTVEQAGVAPGRSLLRLVLPAD